jgi:hypothetical protein
LDFPVAQHNRLVECRRIALWIDDIGVFQDKSLAILGERQTRSNDQDQQDREDSRFHGISPLSEICLLFLEMLPIIFNPLHELLEALIARVLF